MVESCSTANCLIWTHFRSPHQPEWSTDLSIMPIGFIRGGTYTSRSCSSSNSDLGTEAPKLRGPNGVVAFTTRETPPTRLESDVDVARHMLEQFADIGFKLDQVTQQLEDEGMEKFVNPFDILMQTPRGSLMKRGR